MCHPQVIKSRQRMRHDGGHTLQSQGRCEGLRALPLNSMECDRSHESAKQVWANLPAVYREQATFYTDQYAVYTGIIPAAQHKTITKHARKTNPIERFNNTMRQRVSRLVRDTLALSKKWANYLGAIKYFICHYNLTKVAALPV